MKVWKCDLQRGEWVEFKNANDIANMTGNEHNQMQNDHFDNQYCGFLFIIKNVNFWLVR